MISCFSISYISLYSMRKTVSFEESHVYPFPIFVRKQTNIFLQYVYSGIFLQSSFAEAYKTATYCGEAVSELNIELLIYEYFLPSARLCLSCWTRSQNKDKIHSWILFCAKSFSSTICLTNRC